MRAFVNVWVVVTIALVGCATGGDEDSVGVEDSELKKGCPNGPGVSYISRKKSVCATVRYACAEGTVPFNNQCGCGCEPAPGACPNPQDPGVNYVSTDPLTCAATLFFCAPGSEPFFGPCGCGCAADGSANDCVVGGCSGQLCVDPLSEPGISTCEWRPEYACYANATCERQVDGQCGWTQTAELQACLN